MWGVALSDMLATCCIRPSVRLSVRLSACPSVGVPSFICVWRFVASISLVRCALYASDCLRRERRALNGFIVPHQSLQVRGGAYEQRPAGDPRRLLARINYQL